MDTKLFIKEFNKTFGEPFLPEGFATVRLTDYGTIWIEIGDRDSEFDKTGKNFGSGSNVGPGCQWQIEKLVKNEVSVS